VALLAVAALALGAFSLPGAFARSDDHPGKVLEDFPHPSDAVKAQIPLLEVVDALDAFLAEHQIEGFVGAKVDETENALFIFWHGDVPNEVEHFLSKFSDRGHIKIVQVRHSLAQLEELSVRILEKVPELVECGPDENFADVRCNWDSEHEGDVDYDSIESDLEDELDVEISMEAGHQPTAIDVSRSDDVSPFWGGAVMAQEVDEGVVRCTTGFEARKQATDEQVMISAGHCDLANPGGDWVTEDGGRFIGRVADDGHRSVAQDTILLTGEAYDSVVYTGDPNSNVGAPVVGSSRNVVGALLTNSGGLTGQVDNNRTAFVSQFFRLAVDANGDGEADIVGPATISVNLDGVGQVGPGDSGGPQVRPVSIDPDDSTRFGAHAQNINSAQGPVDAECAEGAREPERGCSTIAYGVDVPRILQTFELNLP
jgi:hypothetical protein